MTARIKPKLLTEIEAAIRVRMSPELLRWFTMNPSKPPDSRKLLAVSSGDELQYDPLELDAFDKYLHSPWPNPKGRRAHLPEGIRREIMLESYCACAVCGHGDDGEAAHIQPYSDTACHHPHELIWLCPNHHTRYDHGHKSHVNLDVGALRMLKQTLHESRLRRWRIELRTTTALLVLLDEVDKLTQAIKQHGDSFALSLNSVRERSLRELIAAATAYRHRQQEGESLGNVAALIEKEAADMIEQGSAATHDWVSEVREQYLIAVHEVICPACRGSGLGVFGVCFACYGAGALPRQEADHVEPSEYEPVRCPICQGSGQHWRYSCCTVCWGQGEIEKLALDEIDVADFERVSCPRCSRINGDQGSCALCWGVGEIEQQDIEQYRAEHYEKIQCPECHGGGDGTWGECQVCQGSGEIRESDLGDYDPSHFDSARCPLCEGSCVLDGRRCPVCNGEGQVPAGTLEEFDVSDFALVTCPQCDGTGCRKCRKTGRIRRYLLSE